MSTNVEILVPPASLSSVKEALMPVPGVRFETERTQSRGPRLIVSPIGELSTPAGREGVMRIALGANRDPVVLLGFLGALVEFALVAGVGQLAARIKREPYIAPDRQATRRVILARKAGAEKALIASASLEDGRLVVWSCEPKRYEVSIDEVSALARLDPETLKKFDVTPSGSRIRWTDADLDLDLDAIRERADPEVLRAHEARRRKDASRYGRAIRLLREAKGLHQNEVTGLSERQVRRLEDGAIVPHTSTLWKLADAHGMTVDRYMQALADQSRRSARSRGRRP